MKIHIIRSPELSPVLFTKIIEHLNAIQGGISSYAAIYFIQIFFLLSNLI